MFDDFPQAEAIPIRQRVASYTGYLVLWLAYSAITFWLILRLEEIFVVGAMQLRLNPWQVRAVDKFALVLLGLIWLIGMLMVEHYFRIGVTKRQLMRRAGKVFVSLAVVTAIVIGVNRLV